MQLRIDERGVLVRNPFQTRRIGWPEMGRFKDGSRWTGGQAGRVWALRVVRGDGRAVVSTMASRPGLGQARRSEIIEAVREAAARYGVAAELTGVMPR
jgi:hypothetical protein